VPRWLMIVLLIAAVCAWVFLTSLVGHEPDYGPAP
jgi:hypothetical protein